MKIKGLSQAQVNQNNHTHHHPLFPHCERGHLQIKDFKTTVTEKFTGHKKEVICDDFKQINSSLVDCLDVDSKAVAIDKAENRNEFSQHSQTSNIFKFSLLCFSKKIEKEIKIRMELDIKKAKRARDLANGTVTELTEEEKEIEHQRELEAYHEIPLSTFEDSLRSQAILDALRKSSDNTSSGLSSWVGVELDEYYD